MVRGSFVRAGEVLENDLEDAVDRLRESVLRSDMRSSHDASVYGALDAVLATRMERKKLEEAELSVANQRYRCESAQEDSPSTDPCGSKDPYEVWEMAGRKPDARRLRSGVPRTVLEDQVQELLLEAQGSVPVACAVQCAPPSTGPLRQHVHADAHSDPRELSPTLLAEVEADRARVRAAMPRVHAKVEAFLDRGEPAFGDDGGLVQIGSARMVEFPAFGGAAQEAKERACDAFGLRVGYMTAIANAQGDFRHNERVTELRWWWRDPLYDEDLDQLPEEDSKMEIINDDDWTAVILRASRLHSVPRCLDILCRRLTSPTQAGQSAGAHGLWELALRQEHHPLFEGTPLQTLQRALWHCRDYETVAYLVAATQALGSSPAGLSMMLDAAVDKTLLGRLVWEVSLPDAQDLLQLDLERTKKAAQCRAQMPGVDVDVPEGVDFGWGDQGEEEDGTKTVEWKQGKDIIFTPGLCASKWAEWRSLTMLTHSSLPLSDTARTPPPPHPVHGRLGALPHHVHLSPLNEHLTELWAQRCVLLTSLVTLVSFLVRSVKGRAALLDRDLDDCNGVLARMQECPAEGGEVHAWVRRSGRGVQCAWALARVAMIGARNPPMQETEVNEPDWVERARSTAVHPTVIAMEGLCLLLSCCKMLRRAFANEVDWIQVVLALSDSVAGDEGPRSIGMTETHAASTRAYAAAIVHLHVGDSHLAARVVHDPRWAELLAALTGMLRRDLTSLCSREFPSTALDAVDAIAAALYRCSFAALEHDRMELLVNTCVPEVISILCSLQGHPQSKCLSSVATHLVNILGAVAQAQHRAGAEMPRGLYRWQQQHGAASAARVTVRTLATMPAASVSASWALAQLMCCQYSSLMPEPAGAEYKEEPWSGSAWSDALFIDQTFGVLLDMVEESCCGERRNPTQLQQETAACAMVMLLLVSPKAVHLRHDQIEPLGDFINVLCARKPARAHKHNSAVADDESDDETESTTCSVFEGDAVLQTTKRAYTWSGGSTSGRRVPSCARPSESGLENISGHSCLRKRHLASGQFVAAVVARLAVEPRNRSLLARLEGPMVNLALQASEMLVQDGRSPTATRTVELVLEALHHLWQDEDLRAAVCTRINNHVARVHARRAFKCEQPGNLLFYNAPQCEELSLLHAVLHLPAAEDAAHALRMALRVAFQLAISDRGVEEVFTGNRCRLQFMKLAEDPKASPIVIKPAAMFMFWLSRFEGVWMQDQLRHQTKQLGSSGGMVNLQNHALLSLAVRLVCHSSEHLRRIGVCASAHFSGMGHKWRLPLLAQGLVPALMGVLYNPTVFCHSEPMIAQISSTIFNLSLEIDSQMEICQHCLEWLLSGVEEDFMPEVVATNLSTLANLRQNPDNRRSFVRMELRLQAEVRDQNEALRMKTQQAWEDAYIDGSSGLSGSSRCLSPSKQRTDASHKTVVWERLARKRYSIDNSSCRRPVSAAESARRTLSRVKAPTKILSEPLKMRAMISMSSRPTAHSRTCQPLQNKQKSSHDLAHDNRPVGALVVSRPASAHPRLTCLADQPKEAIGLQIQNKPMGGFRNARGVEVPMLSYEHYQQYTLSEDGLWHAESSAWLFKDVADALNSLTSQILVLVEARTTSESVIVVQPCKHLLPVIDHACCAHTDSHQDASSCVAHGHLSEIIHLHIVEKIEWVHECGIYKTQHF